MPSEENIKFNLRRCRLQAGMKQRELAEKLYVSPQTISKWEKGQTVPDLSNLCRLAQALSVTVDMLLSEESPKGRIAYLGIDGGGTKTDFALCDEKMNILRSVTLEGSNPTVCGMEKTIALLEEGVDALGASSYDLRGIFAGVAGCPDPARRKAIVSALRRRFPGVPVGADADIVNVIYLSEHRKKCIAAICGTGSVAFAQTPKGLFRVGGWGPVFDTAGSGYDIGRDAVRAALAEEDGFGPRTLLTEAVRGMLGSSVFDGAASIRPEDSAAVAAFAPIVFAAERAGDAEAAAILERHFGRLAFLVNTAAKLYDCGSRVVLAGGIASETDCLDRYFLPRLTRGLTLTVVNEKPVFGALQKAREIAEK